jgi:hypothetical protein
MMMKEVVGLMRKTTAEDVMVYIHHFQRREYQP